MTAAIRLTSIAARDRAKRMIDAAPDGHVCSIREATRSTAQNALMWKLLHDLKTSDPLGRGYDAEGYKVLAMQATGHKPRYIIGLEGELIPLGYKSSKLTVPQMTELVEWLLWFGATHNVKWSEA